VQGAGCKVRGLGFEMVYLRLSVDEKGFGGSGFTFKGSGFRVQGSGFRVQGLP
jgi:hypothetical protein